MDSKQFKQVYKYLGNDNCFYVLVKKSKQKVATDNQMKLAKEIEKLEQNKDFLRINVNIAKVGYCSLQNVTNRSKSNSYMLRESIVDKLSNKIGIPLVTLLSQKRLTIVSYSKNSGSRGTSKS